MNLRHIHFVWCSIILGMTLALTACGESETATPPPTVLAATPTPTRPAIVFPTAAPGWKLYQRSTYQIALPDAWQEIKLQENEIKNALVAAQDRNPPLAELLHVLLESGQYKGFNFYAVEPNSAPRARTVSIARASLPPQQDIQALASNYAQALPNVVRGAQVTRVQAPLQINNLASAAFGYTIALVDDNAKLVTVRGAQYLYVLENGDAYLVTITGDADDTAFESTAQSIAATFAARP